MPRQRKGNKTKDDRTVGTPREPVEIHQDADEKGRAPFSSDEEAGDDPVVKTCDVFVSNKLKDYIYLLQYPIKNPDEQYYDDSAPYQARIKPNEGSLEVDVPIDTTNYSIDQGQKFAGAQTSSNGKREKNILDRQRLSGKAQLNQASYFVGTMRGDQMHLSPIRATIQLRPNFHYYDAVVGEKRKKGQMEDGIAKQPRAVQLQMKNSDDPRDLRTISGQQSTMQEEFVSLQWIDTLDPETLAISDQLISDDISKEFISSMTSTEFLHRLSFKDDSEDTHPVKVE